MEKWFEQNEELALLLNLSQAKGIGSIKLKKLIVKYGKPSSVFSASTYALTKTKNDKSGFVAEIKNVATIKFGENQLKNARDSAAKMMTCWSEQYPALLKKIADPPIILFVKGNLPLRQNPTVAIVGTRAPSSYGKQVAEKIAAGLVRESIITVSGFARGIDTIVHSETVKQGGKTIAVLGNGLDMMYPSENKKLAGKIIENGVLISEFPFGTKPDAVNFPRRNRIISGLSLGTIVVEAREKSGALITANLALEQNREVFAIPGSIFSPSSYGPHQLIKEGAKLVSSLEDILEEIPIQRELFQQQVYHTADIDELNPKEKKILECLSRDPIHVDQLALKTQMTTSELLSILLQLEFAGFVNQMPGTMFVRL